MKKIRIIAGSFGLKNTLINAGDPPIEVDDAVARRLVEDKHAAVYVDVLDSSENRSEGDSDEASNAQCLEDMGMPELRKLGAEHGLTFKVGTSKLEMAKQIQQAISLESEDGDNDAADAPRFDAADAVQ